MCGLGIFSRYCRDKYQVFKNLKNQNPSGEEINKVELVDALFTRPDTVGPRLADLKYRSSSMQEAKHEFISRSKQDATKKPAQWVDSEALRQHLGFIFSDSGDRVIVHVYHSRPPAYSSR